jgi:hypothetical protein
MKLSQVFVLSDPYQAAGNRGETMRRKESRNNLKVKEDIQLW